MRGWRGGYTRVVHSKNGAIVRDVYHAKPVLNRRSSARDSQFQAAGKCLRRIHCLTHNIVSLREAVTVAACTRPDMPHCASQTDEPRRPHENRNPNVTYCIGHINHIVL